jgi:hypothetical protein
MHPQGQMDPEIDSKLPFFSRQLIKGNSQQSLEVLEETKNDPEQKNEFILYVTNLGSGTQVTNDRKFGTFTMDT